MSRERRIMVKLMQAMMGRHEDAGPLGLRVRAWLMRRMPGQITCADFEQFVHDYEEGTLGARERRVFDRHMDLCPMCRVHFDSYREAIRLGRRVCEGEEAASLAGLPEELIAAILAARRAG